MINKKVQIAIMFFCFCTVLAGCGDKSQTYNAALQVATDAPSKSGQITLNWDDVPDAKSYNVYYSTSPGVTKGNGQAILNAANPITITDLETGTTYYFVVTAVNESGESKESQEISFTVDK